MISSDCRSSGIAMQMPLEVFLQFWPHIQLEMDKVEHIWAPWWTKAHFYNSVISGQWQCWCAGHGGVPRMFLFTQIAFYPAAKILQSIMMLGNSLDESIDALWAVLEQFARTEGCTRVEVVGRKGLSRKLARYGLREVGVVLTCRVNELRTQ